MPATNSNDILQTTAENEVLDGLAGNDTLSSAFNNTTLIGGAGDDSLTTTLKYLAGQADNIVAVQDGGTGDDRLRATIAAANATAFIDLKGGIGNDVIEANITRSEHSESNDSTTQSAGGAGDDIITASVTDVGGIGKNIAYGGDGNDRINATAITSFFGANEIVTNTIDGGNGDDAIKAYAAGTSNYNDLVTNDVIGGSGNDTIEATTSTNTNSSSSRQLNNVSGGAGDDIITAFTYSSQYDVGADATNNLSGGTGNDTINVKSVLDGGSGFGGASLVHHIQGDAGKDSLISNVTTNASYALLSSDMDGGSDDDILTSSMSQTAFFLGSSYLQNTLSGGQGADALNAALFLYSYDFNSSGPIDLANHLSGGIGDDVLSATINGTIDLSYSSYTLSGNVVNALTGGAGNDKLIGAIEFEIVGASALALENHLDGGAGDDQLIAIGGARNTLDGGTGNDTLTGGTGQDIMSGGQGADQFVFVAFDAANTILRDSVIDFNAKQGDKINLSAFDATAADLVISKVSDHNYTARLDLNHDGTADLTIDVVAAQPLISSNFVF